MSRFLTFACAPTFLLYLVTCRLHDCVFDVCENRLYEVTTLEGGRLQSQTSSNLWYVKIIDDTPSILLINSNQPLMIELSSQTMKVEETSNCSNATSLMLTNYRNGTNCFAMSVEDYGRYFMLQGNLKLKQFNGSLVLSVVDYYKNLMCFSWKRNFTTPVYPDGCELVFPNAFMKEESNASNKLDLYYTTSDSQPKIHSGYGYPSKVSMRSLPINSSATTTKLFALIHSIGKESSTAISAVLTSANTHRHDDSAGNVSKPMLLVNRVASSTIHSQNKGASTVGLQRRRHPVHPAISSEVATTNEMLTLSSGKLRVSVLITANESTTVISLNQSMKVTKNWYIIGTDRPSFAPTKKTTRSNVKITKHVVFHYNTKYLRKKSCSSNARSLLIAACVLIACLKNIL